VAGQTVIQIQVVLEGLPQQLRGMSLLHLLVVQVVMVRQARLATPAAVVVVRLSRTPSEGQEETEVIATTMVVPEV
jgi:hypothetical protein